MNNDSHSDNHDNDIELTPHLDAITKQAIETELDDLHAVVHSLAIGHKIANWPHTDQVLFVRQWIARVWPVVCIVCAHDDDAKNDQRKADVLMRVLSHYNG